MRWIRDKAGVTHPEDSLLLAYTRKQSLDGIDRAHFYQHLQSCSDCLKKCEAYAHINEKLSILAQMQARQRYDFALSERIWESIEQQQRSKKRVNYVSCRQSQKWQMNLFSVFGRPVAMPLALFCFFLLMLGTVALAYSSLQLQHNWTSSNSPEQLQTVTVPVGTGTSVAKHGQVSIPTSPPSLSPTPVKTATAGSHGSPAATPTALSPKPPALVVCTNEEDLSNSRMRFCGSGFTTGDMVGLVIDQQGIGTQMLPPVRVDSQGNFEDSIVINNCRSVPIAAYAQDRTNPDLSSGVIQNLTFGNCPSFDKQRGG